MAIQGGGGASGVFARPAAAPVKVPKVVTGSYTPPPAVAAAFPGYQPPAAPASPPASSGASSSGDSGGGGAGTSAPASGTSTSYLTDPGYLAAVNAETAGNAEQQALLAKGLSNLFIGYGSPALAAVLAQYGYSLTPNDAAAAQANYNAGTATLAQLDHANELAQQKSVNALAAHGIADSGDLGYQLGQDASAYGNAVYNAQQNVLNQAQALQQNELNAQQGLRQQVVTALTNAWNNFVQNPQLYTQPSGSSSGSGGSSGGSGAPAQPTPTNPVPTVAQLVAGTKPGTTKKSGGQTYYQSGKGVFGLKPVF